MNKTRLGKKLLIIMSMCIGMAIFIACYNLADAQYPNYGNVITTSSPLGPMTNSKGDVLIDNFEYWDSPRNHGWITNEPTYPTWGAGIGYGNLITTLDFSQGSRVLDVFMPYSIFLPPYGMQLVVQKMIVNPKDQDLGVTADLLWISIRAPLEIESFALFKLQVIGNTGDEANDGDPFCISFIPTGFNGVTGLDAVKEDQFDLTDSKNTSQNPYVIEVPIGRNFQDGSWHTLNANLLAIVRKAAVNGNTIDDVTITGLRIFGNQYRLDNIWFLKDYSPIGGEPPYFFKIGQQFLQLFQPFQYYCYAKDPDLSYRVFLDIWQNEFEDTGADPNFSDVERLTKEFIRSGKFSVEEGDAPHGHITDPNSIIDHPDDPDAIDPSRDKLFWTATVGAWGAYGTSAPNMMSEIPIANDPNGPDGEPYCNPNIIKMIPQMWLNPYKPCMVSLPTPYDRDEIEEYDPETIPRLPNGTGGVRIFSPEAVAAYGRYLLKLGFKTWPQMAMLYYIPQYLEDLIVTVRVQDSHGRTDLETFPLSVVNYPVTNHPPKMENVDEQAVQVGEEYRYQMVATDQDWFSPDGSFTGDQLDLTWRATIDGLPSYQYGPWSESIINPLTGAINFTPQFEGVYHIVLQVTDSRGLMAMSDIDILCTTSGTWFNHRPYIMGDFNDAAPLVIKAGQLFVLGPPMLDFCDPDGDELYYSCNIGSVVVDKDEDKVSRAYWTFQTNFPGLYWIQITAFDQRGGWTTSEFPIDVQPWWSY